ncbi:uncharacterized protein N7483_012211 [Penicillium malachiteum]|uniref:uncharacterized protein n=1 Tax=Penicillium malachiteum TaxID=1324776 RepID=UPI0025493BC6|nr:uncharacterized protein N7483_012211 [Penicillium malachiteum]KAJ5715030.1 hypothetical protein N7483_012211 [Penicillium malachiteum]
MSLRGTQLGLDVTPVFIKEGVYWSGFQHEIKGEYEHGSNDGGNSDGDGDGNDNDDDDDDDNDDSDGDGSGDSNGDSGDNSI